uniref:Uncharacterized protein n=1 Tax=Oryza punctata TaxID=4537 RepID=A0A0E0M8X9_ORYPU
MSLRQLLLQARRFASRPPPPQQQQLLLLDMLVLCRGISDRAHKALPAQPRHSTRQIQMPQTFHCSNANPLGDRFHIDMVNSDLWPASFDLSMDHVPKNGCPDDFQEHEDEEVHDSEDEIDDMRHRKKLFYKLDRGSKEFEENNVSLRHRRKREKGNVNNPKECKKVDPDEPASVKVPKLKMKYTVREEDVVEAKRDRVPTFNQMTDPYHHPFCLDIHVTKGSVRACFVHRVTSRVVTVAHSISKDMKFDVGSRKGMKACAAVGALLAKRAIEDDIHNAIYTPRKGDRIEGKIEVVLRAIIDNGVDVKVKLKQRKPTKVWYYYSTSRTATIAVKAKPQCTQSHKDKIVRFSILSIRLELKNCERGVSVFEIMALQRRLSSWLIDVILQIKVDVTAK